jgi:hypothetical protein
MADLFIPGDEIESAKDNMQHVIQLFDSSSTSSPSLQEAVGGDGLVIGTAEHFDSRWNFGRSQLKQEGQHIIDSLTKVLDVFTNTDNQLAAQLSPGDGSSTASGSSS